jgi:autotransporter-associated beta strand protein
MRTILAGVVLAVLLGSQADPAWADTNKWTSGTSASWFTPGNWSLGTTPSPTDDVSFATNTTAIIQGATEATAANVFVEQGGLTVGNVSAGALTVDGEISVGTLGVSSALTLNIGTISVNTLSIGANGTYSDTTFGTLILTGTNATIQMAGTVNVVVNSQITGTNGLIKGGTGTLTLAGNNTYSGGTIISLGTLRVGNGGTLGTLGDGDVTNSGALVFNRSDTIIVTNTIAGSGTLTQAGSGTLTLVGTNTYSGNTFINSGTLQVGDGGTSGSLGSGAVSNNSVLAFNRSDIIALTNAISGTGSLVQAGAGTLILTASNTYSGRTLISAGTLQVGDGGTSGLLGTGAVSNDSVLVFNHSDDLVVSNTISGTGSLTKAGGNTLTLVGDNTYSGGTIIDAGTLQVGNGGTIGTLGSGGITNNGVLVFDRGNAILVTNQISGLGSVIQAGTNTLILTNMNTYSGGTWIRNGGTLAVRDSHALGSGDLNLLDGTLNVGTMTIEVGGDFTQMGTSTVQIAIGATNVFGQLDIAGTASLTGTLHVVGVSNYVPKVNDSFMVLVASNGVTGTFSIFTNSITSPSVLLNPELEYNPNDVTLIWAQGSFVPFAMTRNQTAVALNLNAVSSSTSTTAVALISFLDSIPDPTNNLPIAFDLISPEELTALYTIGLAGMDAQGNQFLKRAAELRAGYRGLYIDLYNANYTEGNATQEMDKAWGVYLETTVPFVNVNGDNNAKGYYLSGGGITVGVDRRINDQLVLGAALGYLSGDVGLNNNGNITSESGLAQLYAVWFKEGLHLEGMIGGSTTSYDTKRPALQDYAKGSTDGTAWAAMLNGGYDWQKGPWSFGPQVAVQYESANIDSFTEKGSDAPLKIDSQSADAVYSQVGGAVRYRFNVPGTWTFITPELDLGWRHNYSDTTLSLKSRLASGDGNAFTVYGPDLGSDSLIGNIGVTMHWNASFSTYLNCNFQLGDGGYEAEYLSGGLRFGF